MGIQHKKTRVSKLWRSIYILLVHYPSTIKLRFIFHLLVQYLSCIILVLLLKYSPEGEIENSIKVHLLSWEKIPSWAFIGHCVSLLFSPETAADAVDIEVRLRAEQVHWSSQLHGRHNGRLRVAAELVAFRSFGLSAVYLHRIFFRIRFISPSFWSPHAQCRSS